ncbi:hypothetical protein HMPREF1554_00724 [Porphyromonas gingivalis F0569]|uniref:hypothetical protein n=1 Tax=Porphyromonas gingivalis TaxID=837 RepID=UPI0003AD661E|nr:hypothetical protein [Porphyromonas gingivalis]ERJ69186.1 hypothetical protein HMPREF1554_00724 [Porphyromonas gingivalis F0569]
MKKIFSLLGAMFLMGSLSAQNTIPQSFSCEVSGSARAIECLDGSVFSQAPTDFKTAHPSNSEIEFMQAQNVKGVSSISALRFFGIQLVYAGGWVPQNDFDPMTFTVKICANENGLPGAEIYSQEVALNHNDTGESFGNNPVNVYYWDFEPATPINNLPADFWLVVANSDSDAWFLWLNKPDGVGPVATFGIQEGDPQDTPSYWFANPKIDGLGVCIKGTPSGVDMIEANKPYSLSVSGNTISVDSGEVAVYDMNARRVAYAEKGISYTAQAGTYVLRIVVDGMTYVEKAVVTK